MSPLPPHPPRDPTAPWQPPWALHTVPTSSAIRCRGLLSPVAPAQGNSRLGPLHITKQATAHSPGHLGWVILWEATTGTAGRGAERWPLMPGAPLQKSSCVPWEAKHPRLRATVVPVKLSQARPTCRDRALQLHFERQSPRDSVALYPDQVIKSGSTASSANQPPTQFICLLVTAWRTHPRTHTVLHPKVVGWGAAMGTRPREGRAV